MTIVSISGLIVSAWNGLVSLGIVIGIRFRSNLGANGDLCRACDVF